MQNDSVEWELPDTHHEMSILVSDSPCDVRVAGARNLNGMELATGADIEIGLLVRTL